MIHTLKNCKLEIKHLQKQVKQTKARKESLKQYRLDYIKDHDMDYKTIENRLSQEFPEFVEGA